MYPSRILRAAKSNGQPASITGFDIQALKAATGKPRYDPWERAEAWRFQGPFTRWNRFRGALPGFGTAAVLFAAYCTYEHFFLKDDHHHGEGSEGHH